MNYFDLFQIPKKFIFSQKELTKNFYSLQKKYHPDTNSNKKEFIKEKIFMSCEINKGYQILKDKFTRAEYLLELMKKEKTKKNPYLKTNILTEQFKIYEELEKIKKNPICKKKLNFFIEKINNKIKLHFLEINIFFEKKNILKIEKKIYKLKYLKKILYKAEKLKIL